ncbi:hypothetical protein AC579_77 [Pseudocercospora musae]|uniref:Cytochrome P450 n=1 Tax=Pseudocercospora musae TaxID=113226 RepID=A0A139I0P4_9PEZI|nr:hypothetical protein AC579_77 [Pseudocercospora musae]
MHNYILIPFVGIVVLGLYKVLNIIVTRFQNASRARQLGCQDPPMFPNCGFLGLKHVKLLQAADEKNMFPDFMEERSNIMNKETGRVCATFRSYLLGQTFPDYDLGPIRHAKMGEVLGEGIFVQDGKPWEHSRAMLRPNFVRDQISDPDMEERHVQNLFAALPPQQDSLTAFTNIQELFFRLTMDASTELLFGESVDSQISENPHATKNKSVAKTHDEAAFAINFDQAQLHMAKKFRLVNFHWMHNPKEYQVNNKVVNDFVRYYVNLALKQSNTDKKAEEGHGGEKVVFLEALAKQTRDPDELRGQLLNILLAGRDTTASLLSWLFHQLLRNPHTFGTDDSPKAITFPTLKGCQYLQYTLNEVLRLQTIVPGNGRTANKNTTLPRGGGPDGKSPVFIPAGSQIDYSVHVMHRRKDLWGQDALEFKPERFIGRRPGWEFLLFNGGPRICIGQQFALTEASYVVVRLLQKFDRIGAAPGELEGPVTTDLGLTSCPKRPVTLRLRMCRGF